MVNLLDKIGLPANRLKFFKKDFLKILFVASEARPFIKIGGLGEVMHALPESLRQLGHDARIIIPKYATIEAEKFSFELVLKGIKPESDENDPHGIFISNILSNKNEKGQTAAYFIENMEYYEKRANVYGYSDDAVRWALLSRATLEFIRQSKWKPDVIVAADWQTGLISNYLHTDYKNDEALKNIAVVFSIHNIIYQGMFDHHFVNEMDGDYGQEAIPSLNDPRLLQLNFMRRGIKYADIINTVSSTYAQEITTSEYGELLDPLLKERRSRLFGILNGINYDFYNPKTDPYLEYKYDIKNLSDRAKNKNVLQKKFNLSRENKMPVFGIVSRLTDQKGFGLLMDAGHPLLSNFDFQLIVIGTGDSQFMGFFKHLSETYPEKVAAHLVYDETLSHFVFGGADAIMIPSRFEPCGLTQMEAMRYGAIPIVRKTGGLADSVSDYNPEKQTGTGFVFEKFDHYSFYGAVIRCLETQRYPKHWEKLQKRAMTADFSWTKSAEEYIDLFKKAIEFHQNVLG